MEETKMKEVTVEKKKDENIEEGKKYSKGFKITLISIFVMGLLVGGYFGIKYIRINNAIAECTGNKIKIEKNVVTYDGEAEDKKVVQYGEPESGDLIAHIKIKNHGTITVRFFPEQAPLAVENFVTHAKEGYYDGLTFHRIIDDFMIQGGDPEGTGMAGESIWKENDAYVDFEDEFSNYLMPIRGALCMANAGKNTNGSQFFIVQTNKYQIQDVVNLRQQGVDDELVDYYKENGGAGWLYKGHTVFGQVIDGYDVLDLVAGVKTNGDGVPDEDVVIETISLDIY